MVNIVTNADFSDGLDGWSYSRGVVLVPEQLGVSLPGAGYLAQWCEDALITSNHLYFFCATPPESHLVMLQVHLEYSNGVDETHHTNAEVRVDPPLFYQCRIPVRNGSNLRLLEINNMDVAEAPVILSIFFLDGELPPAAEPEGGAGGMRKMARRYTRAMAARMFDMDKKLDEVLERLGPRESPVKPKSKAPKMPKKGKKRSEEKESVKNAR